MKDAASCPAGSILYTSKAPVALFTDYTKPLAATFKSRSMSNGNAVEVQPFNLDTLDQCPSMVIESRYEDLKPYVMQAGGLFEQSVGGWMDKRFKEQTDTFNKQMYASCESARVKWLADLPTAAESVTNPSASTTLIALLTSSIREADSALSKATSSAFFCSRGAAARNALGMNRRTSF